MHDKRSADIPVRSQLCCQRYPVFFEPPADWFVDPHGEIRKHRRRLPHWQQGPVLYFVTWHLGDSIAAAKLAQWRADRDVWRRQHPGPWDLQTDDEYHRRFTERIEAWLDAGEGSCALRQPGVARIVADALWFFDGQRCDICAFVVMPNHVHSLFRLRPGVGLEEMIKSWKGYTARRINQQLGRIGKLWQEEYWDRLVRDGDHWRSCLEYLLDNPARAGLATSEYLLCVRRADGERFWLP